MLLYFLLHTTPLQKKITLNVKSRFHGVDRNLDNIIPINIAAIEETDSEYFLIIHFDKYD